MTVNIGDVFQIGVEWSLGVERAMTVRYQKASAVLDSDEEVFIPAMIAQILIDVDVGTLLWQGEGCKTVCVTARRMPPGDATRVYTLYGDGTPSARTPARGAQQCALFSTYPESGSSPKQGRAFIPFLAGEYSENGQIDDSAEAGLLSQFGKWISDPIVLSAVGTVIPVLFKLLTPSTSETSDIISTILRPVLATQRRRVKPHQPFVAIP